MLRSVTHQASGLPWYSGSGRLEVRLSATTPSRARTISSPLMQSLLMTVAIWPNAGAEPPPPVTQCEQAKWTISNQTLWPKPKARGGWLQRSGWALPFLRVRLMVAVPTHQGRIAGIFKQKFQCRRFNVAVAKHHVPLASVTAKYVPKFCKHFNWPS